MGREKFGKRPLFLGKRLSTAKIGRFLSLKMLPGCRRRKGQNNKKGGGWNDNILTSITPAVKRESDRERIE